MSGQFQAFSRGLGRRTAAKCVGHLASQNLEKIGAKQAFTDPNLESMMIIGLLPQSTDSGGRLGAFSVVNQIFFDSLLRPVAGWRIRRFEGTADASACEN
jgi:hypothetical protein